MKRRLSFRLFVVFLTIGVIAALIAGFLIDRELKGAFMRWSEEEMAAEARLIALIPPDQVSARIVEFAESAGARITLLDAAGRVWPIQTPPQSSRGTLSTGRKSRKPA
jgi:hypothetical protein